LKNALLSLMTFVEHNLKQHYPPLVWGKDISVKARLDELEVSAVIPLLQEDFYAAADPMRAYRKAVSRYGGAKRQGKNSPHIEFANADSDQKLVRFVQQFGPVVARSVRTEEREIIDDPFDFRPTLRVLIARQDLAELRSERRAYRSALALVSELQRGKRSDIATIRRCVLEIVECVSEWPEQWQRERQLRTSGQGHGAIQPAWLFRQDNLKHLRTWSYFTSGEDADDHPENVFGGPSPIEAGHHVVCELVNAFGPHVYAWGNTPVEAPDWDLTCGIRPVLYYILRREYLHQANGVGICQNTECRDLFELERSGQEFCGDVCSRLQRQREYWRKSGKKLRQRRTKVRKSASARQQGRTTVNEEVGKPSVRK
jgi:hypothetical protein